jgi:uncharacterized protein (DUF736 family)
MTTAHERVSLRRKYDVQITAYWTGSPHRPDYGAPVRMTIRQAIEAYWELKRKVGSSYVAIRVVDPKTGEDLCHTPAGLYDLFAAVNERD